MRDSYEEHLAETLKEFEDFVQRWRDDPQYECVPFGFRYCPEDGVAVEWVDGEMRCPYCGAYHEDYQRGFETAHWRREVFSRLAIGGLFVGSPLKRQWNEVASKLLFFYVDNYTKMPKRGNNTTGHGRLMGSLMEEGDLATKISYLHNIFIAELSEVEQEQIVVGLVQPMIELIKEEVRTYSIINGVAMAGAAALTVAFDLREAYPEVMDGELGLWAQMNNLVNREGLTHDGSFSSLMDLVCAITNFMALLKGDGAEVPEARRKLNLMHQAMWGLSFYNGFLPSSGWTRPALMASGAEMDLIDLFKQYNCSDTICQGGIICSRLEKDGELSYRERERNNQLIPLRSLAYPVSGFTFNRNELWEIFMTYNHPYPANRHYDLLNVEIMIGGKFFSRDYGQSRSKWTNRDWYQQSLAHNTILVDGNNHELRRNSGKLISFTPDQTVVEAALYDGVRARRTILLNGLSFTDTVEVRCQEEHLIDYVFHFRGEVEVAEELFLTGRQRPGRPNMTYQFLKEERHFKSQPRPVSFKVKVDGITLTATIQCAGKIRLGTCLGHPYTERDHVLLIRVKAQQHQFQVHWQIDEYPE